MKTIFLAAAAAVVLLSASVSWAKIGGGDISFDPEGAARVVYSHETHVRAGLKCSECHYQIFNTKEARQNITMAQMEKGFFCGMCHNGKRAFDLKTNCVKCHK